ncbi:MAG TPA: sulfite exporter TauE/SafE family protein [Thermoleophilaceae bacterium]|jgi:ABC-type nickel/cobalt efflux system permease component RcnA
MRRALRAVLLAAIAAAMLAPSAGAHPLGNFTLNHLSRVKVSSDRVDVRYVLDQAEIPTFQERGLSRTEVLRRKSAAATRGLRLTIDGRPAALVPVPGSARISFPPGQGGLKLTRVELDLTAPARGARRIELRDDTFSSRLGWRAIVVEPGRGTTVRSTTPSGDPTGGLRHYPKDLLRSPLDHRSASFGVSAGEGTVIAPRAPGARAVEEGHESGDGFAAVFSNAASGKGVLVLLLLAAFGWGALHALSPGHGKAMVAAYLIGTRGTAKHAAALGGIVTVTHTIGVFALGVVTLALSQYLLPEDLFPWLTLTSGLLVVAVGAGVLRSRLRWARARRAHDRGHGSHGHDHAHDHLPPADLTWRGLVGMGASAGLIPCPSALVVLLGAISQHQVALGLLLILAFSLGLAGTLTALGLAVVYARRLTARLTFSSRIVAALPAASAFAIVAVGCLLTAKAVPQLL